MFVAAYMASDTDTIMLLLSLTPLPNESKLQDSIAVAPTATAPVPSLLLTSPSSNSQPLLVVPSQPALPSKGGAITPSPVHRKISINESKPPYIIIIKLSKVRKYSLGGRAGRYFSTFEYKYECVC